MPSIVKLSKPRVFPPLEHYDYYDLDRFCICPLCIEWRERLKAFQLAQSLVTARVATCTTYGCFNDMRGPCDPCRTGRATRAAFHASNNRRDLYSECSWHASAMEPAMVGEYFMQWLTRILANRTTYKDSWWVGKAPYLSLQYWLTMFQISVTKDRVYEDRLFVDLDSLPRSGLLSDPLHSLTVSGEV